MAWILDALGPSLLAVLLAFLLLVSLPYLFSSSFPSLLAVVAATVGASRIDGRDSLTDPAAAASLSCRSLSSSSCCNPPRRTYHDPVPDSRTRTPLQERPPRDEQDDFHTRRTNDENKTKPKRKPRRGNCSAPRTQRSFGYIESSRAPTATLTPLTATP
ncbi:hypothetical protein BGZ61DRAFT_481619 [Ilyonectria robusta]|uniref:uncharacterized protein n=1 Tax=Ilyonectria robusta TaxID=1079257 RepID=UPI001E8E152B|nr:uncharacterized protein BGZ61DRAFT_481619 [Ilyonectria robusta]KAH8677000.1 hypothetical protein BGZ61DRAFT_481619 [Ilyonectria robusta]